MVFACFQQKSSHFFDTARLRFKIYLLAFLFENTQILSPELLHKLGIHKIRDMRIRNMRMRNMGIRNMRMQNMRIRNMRM